MTRSEYKQDVNNIAHGKRLPNAVYFLRELDDLLTQELRTVVHRAAELHGIGNEFNILKFNTESFAISFLSYPSFWDDPHPALKSAVLVDLLSGRSKRQEFSARSNPPILHRKEAFLPDSHPMRKLFLELTQEEERHGLYKQSTTIGFLSNWTKLLEASGLSYDGHRLVASEAPRREAGQLPVETPVVDRHRTAISRQDLSRPVKTALETGLLESTKSFFDYGCGQGEDIEGLLALGYEAGGWDPVHRSASAQTKADIVNLGYVLNVIEDPAERMDTLVRAWGLAEKALVVTGLTKGAIQSDRSRAFGDGVLTQRNTFQKFFDHTELQFVIEEALGTTAIPMGLGMFAVFREIEDREDFFELKNRRSFDWQVVANRLRTIPRIRPTRDVYAENEELFEELWQTTIGLGRQPKTEEFVKSDEIRRKCGSLRAAHRLLIDHRGEEALYEARARRMEDLLVYLALAKFGARKIAFQQLSLRLRRSIEAFFGTYTEALRRATELLYSAGNVGTVESCAKELEFGLFDQNEGHFSFHRSLLDALPAVLRVYVGCGAQLYGDVREADLIKIHLRSQKLTCTYFEGFERRRFPRQYLRVKLDFGRLSVKTFPAPPEPHRPVLLFKERYLSRDHPNYSRMLAVSKKLRHIGIREEQALYGMDESEFLTMVDTVKLD